MSTAVLTGWRYPAPSLSQVADCDDESAFFDRTEVDDNALNPFDFKHPVGPRFVQMRRSHGAPLDCSVYVPRSASRGVFVSVHGVSRNTWEHITSWAALAEELGFTLAVPLFSKRDFPGYQRLESGCGRSRPNAALLSLLVRLRVEGYIRPGPRIMFGYSGGAQFLHRFLLAHPGAADAGIIAAAGWYTFPDREQRYPYGLGRFEATGVLDAKLAEFLSKPLLVTVGDGDTEQDAQLRSCPMLDAQQGRTRLERAHRWIAALRTEAAAMGVKSRIHFADLPKAGHSFMECVDAGLDLVVRRFIKEEFPSLEEFQNRP